MQSGAIIPGILFVAGIIAIFISGGAKMVMLAGNTAIFLSGIAFLKVLK